MLNTRAVSIRRKVEKVYLWLFMSKFLFTIDDNIAKKLVRFTQSLLYYKRRDQYAQFES